MIQASLIVQHLRRRWSQGRRFRLPEAIPEAGPRDGISADPRVRELVAALTSGFRLDGNLRREIAEEMIQHLEDSVEDKLATGMTREAALVAALQEFGPAAEVAQGLREANRTRWLADVIVRFVLTPLAATLCAILAALVSLGTMKLSHFDDVVSITLLPGLQVTLSWILVVAAWIGCSFGGWIIQRQPFVTEIGSFFGVCTAVLLTQGAFLGNPLLLPLAIPLACIAYDVGMMLVTDWCPNGFIGRLQSAGLCALAMGSLLTLACTAFVLPQTSQPQRPLAEALAAGLLYGCLWGWFHSRRQPG